MPAQYHLLKRYGNDALQLRGAIQADPTVRAEAEEELRHCETIAPERCVVTKEYADALREALNAAG